MPLLRATRGDIGQDARARYPSVNVSLRWPDISRAAISSEKYRARRNFLRRETHE